MATFNWGQFQTRWPSLGTLDQAFVAELFVEAGDYFANDGTGPENDPAKQGRLMNLVTAHLCLLYGNVGGKLASPLVGRISNASTGSVSVSTDNQYPPGSAQWWQQTKPGSAFWEAAALYRTMMYFPAQCSRGRGWPFY